RSVSLALGDTVILFSDGIKDGFAETLVLSNSPQEIADSVITRHVKGNDDALVLVARYGRYSTGHSLSPSPVGRVPHDRPAAAGRVAARRARRRHDGLPFLLQPDRQHLGGSAHRTGGALVGLDGGVLHLGGDPLRRDWRERMDRGRAAAPR